MGLTESEARRLERNLKPLPLEPTPTQPELVTEDATIGNEERLRGIPCVGRVSGTIKGTRPGDSAKALEQAGKDILRSTLGRNRYRPSST